MFLNHFPPYILRHGVSLNLELTNSARLASCASQLPPEILLLGPSCGFPECPAELFAVTSFRKCQHEVMQWSLQDVLFLNWNLLRLTNAGTLSPISGL